MQAYDPEYVQHDLPLVFLSGLGIPPDVGRSGSPIAKQESGIRIVTASPVCEGDRAVQLLDQLLKQDGSQRAWNSAAQVGPNGGLKYRMKPIGRTFTLPPRKAAPLPQSPSAEGFQTQHRNTELHSPLSPLSPGSPIYPDGVFTPQWMEKHQEHVPALLIAFFSISTDDGSTAQNEQIQIDINAVRTALSRSGFKTKFAAVLISDKSILHAPELEDRLSAIRRATTLDLKTGLFFMPPMSSQTEIASWITESVLTPLKPLVMQHYRDLTTRARRKKARGGPTAMERGAHTLSASGWNARYEIKQAVFAEFRQEMDEAERHYSQAIEELFSSEGVLEATPSWSPRWSEARLLTDVLALRTLRCQLFSGLATGAAVSWVNYRARVKDLVDRRGAGSQTCGFDAWQSRWAEIMSQLILHTALPALQPRAKQAPGDPTEPQPMIVYAPFEKTAERLAPFHLLHHPGYWLSLAFKAACARFRKALEVPEEDVDKGYDHIADLRRLATEAAHEFDIRGQARSARHVQLALAHHLARAQQHAHALDTLLPLWENSTWRDEAWDDLSSSLLSLLHDCAIHASNAEVFLATAWELQCVESRPASMSDQDLLEYVGRCQPASDGVAVEFENTQRLTPVTISLAFVDKNTHVGELVECQLTLESRALARSAPITLSRVQVALSDTKTITINHSPNSSSIMETEMLLDLSGATSADDGTLNMEADLTLRPSQKRICSLFLTFREAGVVRLQQVSVVLRNSRFCLKHRFTDEDLMRTPWVYALCDNVLEKRLLSHPDTTAVRVLPKPPKMRVSLYGLHEHYYADERTHLELELVNEEPETVDVVAALHVSGNADEATSVNWNGKAASQGDLALESLAASASHKAGLTVLAPAEPCTFTLEIEIRYTLESEPTTSLTKTLTTEMEIAMPFDAKYNLSPLLQRNPWPSYFDTTTMATNEPEGIPQGWLLGCHLESVAADNIMIRDMRLAIDSVADDATCKISDQGLLEERALTPKQSTAIEYDFVTCKTSIDDRSPSNVELSLIITWARLVPADGHSAETTTRLRVPRLALPSSEPRALCTIGDRPSKDTLVLEYHLENPSMHFLTFAITMEANESYAFNGPKYRTLSLAPLSRLLVQYDLVVYDLDETEGPTEQGQGRWIWPVWLATDLYYQKNLKVHSGGPHVKSDEKRGLGVLVSEV
ncbi:hypothetical protein LTR85_003297 [Meristemomyces frigidus]|nr:hypothetical protein LTR85_003297 [Meristemomyces frigidus]